MRYRRLSYRYVIARATPVTQVWGRGDLTVMFGAPQWRPDADLCETQAAFEITVELGGVQEDDVEIQLFEDALVIEGRRDLPASTDAVYHTARLRRGPFRLELPLPGPVAADGGEVRYERGLLRVRLPKPGGTA
jgi:HSP20 family protein